MTERTTTGRAAIGPETTINEAILALPEAVAVFDGFGLDACCGGGLSIAEAARRHGLDVAEVLDAVRATEAPRSEG